MTVDEHERYAHDQLDALRREYELRARPYIEILCKINATRPPKIVITIDELQRLGIRVPPVNP